MPQRLQDELVLEHKIPICIHPNPQNHMKPHASYRFNHLLLGTLAAALCLCAISGSVNAAVIFSVTDSVPKPGGVGTGTRTTTTNLGTVGTLTSTLPNYSYTITGLDLTSVGGGASDSVTFRMAYTQTGSTLVVGSSFGNIGVGTASGNALISGAEILTVTPTITSATSTLALSNFSIAINRVQLGDYGSGDITSVVHDGGTIGKTFASDTNSTVTFANSSFASIDPTSGDGTTLQAFRVEITVIPEPSTALLGCLGILLMLRRRR